MIPKLNSASILMTTWNQTWYRPSLHRLRRTLSRRLARLQHSHKLTAMMT